MKLIGVSARMCSRRMSGRGFVSLSARTVSVAPGTRDFEAGRGFLHQGERSIVTRFRFVAEEAAQFPVSLLCRAVGVTRQGFYAWRSRPASSRALADAALVEQITRIHDETLGIYGAPRIPR